MDDRWLLPEGIEEVLPEAAKKLESLRRQLLDLYCSWGYELVIPPFIEYLESLLNGFGSDLELQTFKLTDQLTGRMMGIRADMTPQLARIDSVVLHRQSPVRLCYIGTVLRTRPLELGGARSPVQVGIELYGHTGYKSDIEVIELMSQSLKLSGIDNILLDLGHVGIFRGLVRQAGLDANQEERLFSIIQHRSVPELEMFFNQCAIGQVEKNNLAALYEYNGGEEVLEQAAHDLQNTNAEVLEALQTLQSIAKLLKARDPGLSLHFDLAELRGYRYHTGVIFSAYSTGLGKAIAQGGRYHGMGGHGDKIGRPATGFSADLKQLVQLSNLPHSPYPPAILAPWDDQVALRDTITALRHAGERVIYRLDIEGEQKDCDRELIQKNGRWLVVPLSDT